MKLSEAVPWGRNLEEYRMMFALGDGELNSRILSVADGPASFNVELSQQGRKVVSVDPIYQFTATEIQSRIDSVTPKIRKIVIQDSDRFCWDYYRDADHLVEIRHAAMAKFLADFSSDKVRSRYITGSLPLLPFEDNSFGLAVCSHFLFLYDHLFDFEFLKASCRELLRVAEDVRIFPLLGFEGERSAQLKPLLAWLDGCGFGHEVVRVDHEFQRGGNEMLRLTRL